MNWGSPGMIVLIVAVCTIGWLVNNWIRAKHGYPLEYDWGLKSERSDPAEARKIELLTNENEQLTGKIGRLEERLAVLERIATEKEGSSQRLRDEIEKLRS